MDCIWLLSHVLRAIRYADVRSGILPPQSRSLILSLSKDAGVTALEVTHRSHTGLYVAMIDIQQEQPMTTKYKVGDHVSWNSEAGRVSGKIIKVHTSDFDYKGHTHRASKDDPQYEIKSDKTDHIAAHKDSALRKIS